MISLTRLDEPKVLRKNKEKWQAKYLEKLKGRPRQRPPSSQYGHKEIRNVLEAMSFGKCFYCEQKLSGTKSEVDHYIEITEKPELAFEWANLYLCCWDCNHKKIPNSNIPVSDCLNPCDPLINPGDHLTFEGEMIRPKSGSPRGLNTIRKYRLDRDELDGPRLRQIKLFQDVVIEIKDNLIRENRKRLNDSEKEILLRFKQPDWPFSLMFSVYLDRLNL